ncbi:pentapeptide repeat-containing protein [Streptomyces sp. NPDC051214]|uniref:pentapeptide repeat-containing protein n=1 Tax=Streptomyces sp. NPDC051214 TaxID=3155282 RepID=UPI00341825B1
MRQSLSPGLVPQLPLKEDIRAALHVLARSWRRDGSKADLRSVDLYGWIAGEADFTGANMRRAQLQSAALSRAGLQHAQLQGADLSDAVLSDAFLSDALLPDAVLNRAQLQGTCLRRANLRGALLKEAKLNGAHLQGADLHSADLQDADLTRADLDRAKLADVFMLNVGQVCSANVYDSTELRAALASDPDVRSRIAACEEARAQGKPPPDADPTQFWAS